METHDILVIGGSAGALAALRDLVRHLPGDFPATIFVVLHTAPYARSYLPDILSKDGPLPAFHALDGEPIVPGRIVAAPPNLHMLLERGYVRVTHGPTENRVRPAVDVLFRSAAYAYGPRVVGVVLSGALNDGTAGLWAIKYRGGVGVVQEPEEAFQRSMPMSAIENVEIDHRLRVAEMAPMLVRLAHQQVTESDARDPTRAMEIETRIAMSDRASNVGVLELGEPSLLTCPECHGTLLRVNEGSIERFRCHTGHAYSADSLLAEVDGAIEDSLSNTLRVLEEKAYLLRQTGERAHAAGTEHLARIYLKKAEDARNSAEVLRAEALRHQHLSRDLLNETKPR